ncbi:MAG: hypothetical protein JO254_06925 [Pseudolabrys sp.]|nr:hypothetical protein [Pseudolabrys sp.]
MTLRLLFITAAASALIGAQGAAHAQYYVAQSSYGSSYQPEPLYPYVVQPQANAYVIPVQPQPAPRAYPYVRPNKIQASVPRSNGGPKVIKRFASAGKVDPVLIEELKERAAKNPIPKKEIIVREKPIVIEHKRVVDDPPIVVQREQIIDEYHVKSDRPRGLIRNNHAEEPPVAAIPPSVPSPSVIAPPPGKGQRVIRAEAEVTILGPDRMSIRLFRKRGEPAPDVAED